MTGYANFRQRLDAILRTMDVSQVQKFLIAEKQWQTRQPADREYAMWMMIVGSPGLADLHAQARLCCSRAGIGLLAALAWLIVGRVWKPRRPRQRQRDWDREELPQARSPVEITVGTVIKEETA